MFGVGMASIPGSHYDIYAPGQTVDFGLTYDANSFAPPVSGEFNLEVIINSTGTAIIRRRRVIRVS